MRRILIVILDFVIPRVVTEEVAVNWDGDGYKVVCPVSQLDPYEEHMGVCEITALSWLGFGLFGRMKVPPQEFHNPNREQ